MSCHKSKTLMASSDEDIDIEDDSSPKESDSKKISMLQKGCHSAKDWQRCGDDFAHLTTFKHKRKKKRAQNVSLVSEHKDFEESIELSQEDIIWSSSDEESNCELIPSSKRFTKTEEKLPKLTAETSSNFCWPTNINDHANVKHEKIRKNVQRNLISNFGLKKEDYESSKLPTNEISVTSLVDQQKKQKEESHIKTVSTTNTSNLQCQSGVTIEDFPSDEEISSIEELSPPPSKKKNTTNSDISPEIGISSWSSSTQNSQAEIRKKASNWVEIIEVSTPTKNQGEVSERPKIQPEISEHDSAKKKRKYVSNGLAAKLLRFQARSRVDSNIRYYQQNSKWSGCSEMLTVSIEKITHQYGIVNAMCVPGTYSEKKEWIPNSNNSHCTVLFSYTKANDLKLSVGSLVQIYPPWQELSLRADCGKVLLCTNHCHKLEVPIERTSIVQTDPIHADQQQVHWALTWNCPCSSSGSLKQCPANACPSLTKCPTLFASNSQPLSTKEIPTSESTLTTVTIPSKRIHIDSNNTILDSIQGNPNLPEYGMCFQATILRVFLFKNYEESLDDDSQQEILTCWSVLVEDTQGTVSLVHLPSKNSFDKENQIVPDYYAVNCIWNFYGMRVLSRANRHRDPDLFSIIDTTWVCPQIPTEAENEIVVCTVNQETQVTSVAKNTPGFCYEIGPQDTSFTKSGYLPAPVTAPWTMPKLDLVTLKDFQQKVNEYVGQRVTFIGKLVYNWSKCEADQNSCSIDSSGILYVTDSSISSGVPGFNYIAIHYRKSFILPSQLSTVVLIKDVLIQQKNFAIVDRFSRIWTWPLPDHVTQQLSTNVNIDIADKYQSIKLSLPNLKIDSNVYNLVKVQGVIYSVDQDKAVIWQTCPKCDKEELALKKNNEESWLFCFVCNCQVDDTVTHITMEVIIRCLALPGNYQVTVNLQQKTIEGLLPGNNSDDGYDVSTVLGQQLGPLTCLLKKHNNLPRKQISEFYLEEIQLI
ncbi:Hypothetical predicted protein [Octopus vulgaris]|uniref:DUF4503 domain-containing protein n=2 Tax=Octopus vulgaris TaxID=6645 RepID=A0AA36AH08_OCTVU|nr:Hypothetical predicted protein [Octopus vulgaris]